MEQEETQSNAQKSIVNIVRPVVIAFLVMLALSLGVYYFNIPNPNMILITGLAVFTSIHGYGAGIASGIVMIVYSMFFFSENHSFIQYTEINLEKVFVIILGVVLNVVFIGQLKSRKDDANRKLQDLNRMLKEDNLTLEAATIKDSLSGVKNRFALRRDYDNYKSGNLHVMMFDVDDFKMINDTYGHSVGDYILNKIGKSLYDAFGFDHSYRYGGDEFLVIYPEIAETDFKELVNRMRQELAEIYLDDQKLPANFSAGYVFGELKLQDDLRLMMRQADDILYSMKNKGKNMVDGKAYNREEALEIKQAAAKAFRH